MGQKNIHILGSSSSKKIDGKTLKTYKGFETLDDKQAESMAEQIERFAEILYRHVVNQK